MITVQELEALVDGHADSDDVRLVKPGYQGCIGERVVLMPGVVGQIVEVDEDGSVVRVRVRMVRHALSLLAA